MNGTLCELEERASLAHQPYGGVAARLVPGAYMLYLDVWQRHLSALQAPAIREVALGGPDTATRAQTVVQVKALALPAASPFDWNCSSSLAAWDALVNAPRPRLAARAEPQLAAANLCEIAATAGYRRLENQLYRVEVHEGGANPDVQMVARERLGRLCGRRASASIPPGSRPSFGSRRVVATPTSTWQRTTASN